MYVHMSVTYLWNLETGLIRSTLEGVDWLSESTWKCKLTQHRMHVTDMNRPGSWLQASCHTDSQTPAWSEPCPLHIDSQSHKSTWYRRCRNPVIRTSTRLEHIQQMTAAVSSHHIPFIHSHQSCLDVFNKKVGKPYNKADAWMGVIRPAVRGKGRSKELEMGPLSSLAVTSYMLPIVTISHRFHSHLTWHREMDGTGLAKGVTMH